MAAQRSGWRRLAQLMRFYQAAIANTIFGLSAYAVLVWLGLNIFLAQAVAYVLGVTFNYVTYSRYVFRDTRAAKGRFVLSYAVNYVANVALLALLSRVIASPYISGIATALIVSVGNFFALKYLVFRPRPA